MRATELMLGDWVMHFGEIAQIAGIRNDLIGNAFKTDLHDTWYDGGTDGIEPILLTTEILEKNRFTKELDADGIHYRFTVIAGDIMFSILYARSVFQWLGQLDFKYVHELQHTLRVAGLNNLANNFKV